MGARLARTTASEDHWKRSWQDNALSALLSGRALYNYYDVRAITAYLVQRVSPGLQVTVGGRCTEHGSRPNTADWSFLESGPFRPNPPADVGGVRLGLLVVEGGQLTRRSEHRSLGTIAGLYAELVSIWGAPLSYDRAVVDVQTYQAVADLLGLNLRGRVGWTTSGAPTQMQFRLDGVRGLRGTDPQVRAEERLLLGGTELVRHNAPVPPWPERA